MEQELLQRTQPSRSTLSAPVRSSTLSAIHMHASLSPTSVTSSSHFDSFADLSSSFQVGELLGEGGFSRVYKAISLDINKTKGHRIVALKRMTLLTDDKPKQIYQTEHICNS